MASLSQQMKNKRDIRRRSSILIIDKDLGNYGLYKSILAMEYELECVNSINMAMNMCKSRYFDVIIADGSFSPDVIGAFNSEVAGMHDKDAPILLVLEEPENKESIISFLCEGARDYIAKPFSKEGLTNAIYEQLKKRREHEVRQSILIVDSDYELLKSMKSYLAPLYDVSVVNCCEVAERFAEKCRPDLIICDFAMFRDTAKQLCEISSNQNEQVHMLFMTDNPNAEVVSECAKFNPEGFMIKPIEKDMLIKTLERIFLMESYTSQGR